MGNHFLIKSNTASEVARFCENHQIDIKNLFIPENIKVKKVPGVRDEIFSNIEIDPLRELYSSGKSWARVEWFLNYEEKKETQIIFGHHAGNSDSGLLYYLSAPNIMIVLDKRCPDTSGMKDDLQRDLEAALVSAKVCFEKIENEKGITKTFVFINSDFIGAYCGWVSKNASIAIKADLTQIDSNDHFSAIRSLTS